MKIFIALVFIIVSIIGLIRGSIFKGALEKMKELAADFHVNYYERDSLEYSKKMALIGLPPLLWAFVLTTLEVIFYISVVGISVLTLPTIFMMTTFIFNFIKSYSQISKTQRERRSNTALDKAFSERANAEKIASTQIRSPYRTVLQIISLIYFVFALLVLIVLL